MKIYDIINEDGVIVPGVNTTVDVKPGQTEKEAAKFFGKGKPAELHKKARKNSNAHTLYNLGLTEDKNKVEAIPKDDKNKDVEAADISGFDPQTAMAVKQLRAKYPHADNIMSALMAQTNQTLQNQYKGDKRRDEQDRKHSDKFDELEQKLLNIIKKNKLSEGKRK
jgi:cellobiose-specific phosphotransferase system component IIB